MGIKNYTTQVSTSKTIGEIQQCLVDHGATKIVCDYEVGTGIPVAVTFTVPVDGKFIYFSLPANYSGVMKVMDKDKKTSRSKSNKEQAVRVAWRIVKDWIEAQMALVEAELADITEVFLPYAVTKDGGTLYKEIKADGMKMLDRSND